MQQHCQSAAECDGGRATESHEGNIGLDGINALLSRVVQGLQEEVGVLTRPQTRLCAAPLYS